jgi:hypothetical protein
MMKKSHTQTFPIPGTRDGLTYERDDSGRLMCLSCNGRVYLHERDGRRIFGDELATVSEVTTASSLLRHVRAGGEFWTEKYLWDTNGRAVYIDGVEMRYDARNRITACLDSQGNGNGNGNWFYAYAGDDLVTIDGPFGVRHLARGTDGRPVRVREGSCAYDITYDADGRRCGVPPIPESWHRDTLGRLWTVADSDGTILTTYLWDGFACLGRIDGPPGEPLAVAFCLDFSLTPVRVITGQGGSRVPRDAFGEGLLVHAGVPGLYGGAIHDGFVHLPARALDPRTGAFDTPEPWHGLEDDPRRAEGYRGPLTVEKAPAGPYAVCQNDPVGRTDPTGAISAEAASALMWVSDFTWALQNNLVGWLGMDGWFNLFGSLFSCNMDRFGSSDPCESVRKGTIGVRRDGAVGCIMEPRAFTFQHIIWSSRQHIDELADARVFVPGDDFQPNLYGTLLRVNPSSGHRPFLLRGSRSPGNVSDGSIPPGGTRTPEERASGWTRAGGTAEPVIPGSPVPHFPTGGVHFDAVRQGLRNHEDPEDQLEATIAELDVSNSLGVGTIEDRLIAVVRETGLGLAAGDLVLLTLGEDDLIIAEVLSAVEEGGTTRVRLEIDVDEENLSSGASLRSLNPPTTEANPVNSVSEDALNLAGTNAPYAVNDPLRLTQNNAESVVLIKGLEARIEIDEPLPPTMRAPLTIATATQTGQPQRATISAAQEVDFTLTITDANDEAEDAPPPPLPDKGAAITLTQAGLTLAVVVTAVTSDPSSNVREVDRNLSALDANLDVFWQPLTRVGDLGTRDDAPETDSFVTYKPDRIRAVPTVDYLWIEGTTVPGEDTENRLAVRTVVSAVHDAIVLSAPLPGDTTQPYTVEHFTYQGDRESVRSFEHEQALALDPPATLNGEALQVQRLGGPAVDVNLPVDAASVFQIDINAATGDLTAVAGNARPTFPTPAQVVRLDDGATYELALVTRVEVKFPLDRELTVNNQGLEVVPLAPGGPQYQAWQTGPLELDFGAAPPFNIGDELTVDWSTYTANQFRVTAVEGTTLTLEGGNIQPVDVDDGTTIHRMDVRYLTVIARPYVGPVRVQMPRFGVGEIVQAENWPTAADPPSTPRTRRLTVRAISGTKITLQDDVNLSAPRVGLTIQRLVPGDPATGGTRAGIEGVPDGATTTDHIWFRVWQPNALRNWDIVAIVDGDNVFPARIDSGANHDVRFTFADTPALSGTNGVNISAPQVAQTWYAASFTQESNASAVLRDIWPSDSAIPSSADLVAAIPFQATTDQQRIASGELSPGRVRIPADPDGKELTRRQSLIEHELIHTRQFTQWGQLMLSPFPLWLLELCFEDLTDGEEHPFSDWTGATIESHDSRHTIQIDAPPVTFAEDDCVQVFCGQSPTMGELEEPVEGEENKFFIDIDSDVSEGAARVRRCESSSIETLLNILQPLSAGGMLNTVVGSTYAALLGLLGRGIYACIPSLSNTSYPATVEQDEEGKKKILRLPSEESGEALRRATRVIVQSGGSTVVRAIDTIEGDAVKLRSAVTFEGEVDVSLYSTHAPGDVFDWYSYYPAQVPDPDRPSTIQLFDVNGDSLTLSPHDRVTVARPEDKWYHWGFHTTVAAVNDDGTVDLKDPPPTSGEERDLRIAKIGEEDPLSWVDGWVMNEFGMGWLRWLFDPYGQLHFRISPEHGSGWDIALKIGRYAFSTRSWSPVMLGSLLWFNLAYQPDNGHMAEMEQEAAQESGDMYSAIGRLEGTLDVVGDVVRYWYFLNERTGSLIRASRQDAPGVHIKDDLRLMPFVTGEPGGYAPNNGATAGPTEPGSAVPDAFVRKDPGNPMGVTPGLRYPQQCFASATRGWIPTSTVLHRASGMYVAFTRPGHHRITVRDNDWTDPANPIINIPSAEEGREAQEANSYLPPYGTLQTLFFEKQVADVTVRIAGRLVNGPNPGDSVPTVRLVQTQRAVVKVEPNEGRRYAVMLTSPVTGDALRAESDMVLVAQMQNAIESVDIARVHRCNDAGEYDSEALNIHGVHLPEDLYITVRRLEIEVVDTLTVREEIPSRADLEGNSDVNGDLTLDIGENDELRPGEVRYILVPTEFHGKWSIRLAKYQDGTQQADVDDEENWDAAQRAFYDDVDASLERVTVADTDIPDGLRPFLGDGGILKVIFANDHSLTKAVDVELKIDVGPEDAPVPLKAMIHLIP